MMTFVSSVYMHYLILRFQPRRRATRVRRDFLAEPFHVPRVRRKTAARCDGVTRGLLRSTDTCLATALFIKHSITQSRKSLLFPVRAPFQAFDLIGMECLKGSST